MPDLELRMFSLNLLNKYAIALSLGKHNYRYTCSKMVYAKKLTRCFICVRWYKYINDLCDYSVLRVIKWLSQQAYSLFALNRCPWERCYIKCYSLSRALLLPDPEYAAKLRSNPAVQLAVRSFRTMRRSALTPVARRLRDVMVQRYPVYPPAVNLNALNNTDWTEVYMYSNMAPLWVAGSLYSICLRYELF